MVIYIIARKPLLSRNTCESGGVSYVTYVFLFISLPHGLSSSSREDTARWQLENLFVHRLQFHPLSVARALLLVADFPRQTLKEKMALLRLVIFYDMKFNSIRFYETSDGVITAVLQISPGITSENVLWQGWATPE